MAEQPSSEQPATIKLTPAALQAAIVANLQDIAIRTRKWAFLVLTVTTVVMFIVQSVKKSLSSMSRAALACYWSGLVAMLVGWMAYFYSIWHAPTSAEMVGKSPVQEKQRHTVSVWVSRFSLAALVAGLVCICLSFAL